ncbi:hypothetical protein [Actinophytocola xanthii]|uniref:Anti-sigma factor n=1 Tax=Actinophytocola xanthii TaxID=1912961 RepID=A0A1Q8CVC9_9PSEU|nr:hypothetical protein [Actinophytocola xanthii]OLF18294.1 hypothetical protein BU204_06980 [Actinophytocola xanthii]
MTESVTGAHGPPWSVDLLADLHAGVLDAETAARLWPRVNADPEARAVLEALDSVKVGLGQLAHAPVEPMPAHVAARLDAALAAEARSRFGPPGSAAPPRPSAPPRSTEPPAGPSLAPVTDLAAARRRRNRMAAWGAGLLTAAAAAAAIAFIAIPGTSTDGAPVAGKGATEATEPPDGAEPPLALSGDDLNPAIGQLTGEKDYGQLENEQGLKACLDGNDIPSGDTIGVHPVTLDGQEGIAALLGAGTEPGKFRVVVVEPTCTGGNPDEIMADAIVGN